MKATGRGKETRRAEQGRPDRAVIDIGSNTVRLVVYSGAQRAPDTFLNEKVVAKLGKDLAETGRIPEKAAGTALDALRRYQALVAALDIPQVDVVATAAVRDAQNGPEFLARVRALGLNARLLDGEEEARASATGVIAAFPGAHGVVSDLGGGSLELVSVEDDRSHHGVSLPFGTLRLRSLRKDGSESAQRQVAESLGKAGWAAAHPGPLYMVGGTWRALARYAMQRSGHPLSDPHGLRIKAEEARRIAGQLVDADPGELRQLEGISALRAAALPDAAALLRTMLAELKPSELVFSSWGLREGLLYQRLPALARRQDPLLAGIAHFTTPRGGTISRATMMAGWTADVARGDGTGSERLRLAATLLALAASRLEPNIRTAHMLDWALHKRWIGLDMAGRARIAAALIGACEPPALPAALLVLEKETQLREALGWGLAFRLCRRIGAGSRMSMVGSSLTTEGDSLVLAVSEEKADLMGDIVRSDLVGLAEWLGKKADIRVTNDLAAPNNLTIL